MSDIRFVRQRPTRISKYYDVNSATPNRSTWPTSQQTFGARLETDRKTFVTGMNENAASIRAIKNPEAKKAAQKKAKELRERYEQHFNVDLGPTSEYWDTFRLKLVRRDETEYMLDLDKPEEALQYYVGIANYKLAPSEEALDEDGFEETFLYVYDPKAHTSRRARLQEIKDEVGYLIHTYRNNKDRLFYWAAALGMVPNANMTREDLYNKVNAYRETRKTVEDYESFQVLLNKTAEELQATYLFKQGRQKKRITKANGFYVLDGVELGKLDYDSIEALIDPENAVLLDSLMDLAPKL